MITWERRSSSWTLSFILIRLGKLISWLLSTRRNSKTIMSLLKRAILFQVLRIRSLLNKLRFLPFIRLSNTFQWCMKLSLKKISYMCKKKRLLRRSKTIKIRLTSLVRTLRSSGLRVKLSSKKSSRNYSLILWLRNLKSKKKNLVRKSLSLRLRLMILESPILRKWSNMMRSDSKEPRLNTSRNWSRNNSRSKRQREMKREPLRELIRISKSKS